MDPTWPEAPEIGPPADDPHDPLADRVESLAAWVRELDGRVRSAELAGNAESLEELSRSLETWATHGPKLANRMDVVEQRLTTLAETVATTASRLSGREGELVTLRREVEDATATVASAIADLRGRVDPTPVRDLQRAVAMLSEEVSALKQSNEELFGKLTRRADALRGRLDSLAGTVTTAGASLTAHERALGELSTELEAGRTRVDTVVAVMRQAIDSLLSQVVATEQGSSAARVESLAHRLEALSGKVDSLATALESSWQEFVDTQVQLAALQRKLDARLDELARRLVETESQSAAGSESTARDEVAQLDVELDEVHPRLAASDR